MDQDIRAKVIFQIPVGGHVLMGGRNVRIMQDLAHLAVAPRPGASPLGLDADHGVVVLHTGHQDFSLIDHGRRHPVFLLARRFSPGIVHALFHLGGKGVEPVFVFLFGDQLEGSALVHDLVHRGPAEFADGLALHDGVYELFSVRRRVHIISGLFHAVHDPGHAFQGVQMGAAAHRGLHRGAGGVHQNKGHLAKMGRFLAQMPPS